MDALDWARCGTQANYSAHRARCETPCDACKKAYNQAKVDRRRRRLLDPSLCAGLPHGTMTGYCQGCRCPECTQANTDYHREYMARRRRERRGSGPSAAIPLLPLEGVRRGGR